MSVIGRAVIVHRYKRVRVSEVECLHSIDAGLYIDAIPRTVTYSNVKAYEKPPRNQQTCDD
jgi:hypothetical protein